MQNKKIYIVLIAVFALFSCSKSEGPASSAPEAEEQAPDPAGSYDYSSISDHPRILLKGGEEEKIKQSLSSNPDLAKVHNLIITYCDGILKTSLLKYDLEGKRLLTVSRNALKRIFFLSYAYRMTGNELYSIRAEAEMLNVSKFKDWNPSHYLDVGEMALGVSIGYDWLFDQLQPSSRKTIKEALISKAVETSKEARYNSWLQRNDNWNQVCNAGILYAALAVYENDKARSAEMIERYLQSIIEPLKTYGPDGNYTEGYSYWSYGTGFQVLGLSALETSLGSDKNLSATPGFLKTAQYLQYMTGPSGLCFNYSDSDSKQIANPFMYWFANKANDPSMLFVENSLLKSGLYLKSSLEDRLLPLTLIFAKEFGQGEITEPQDNIWIGHGDNPIAIVRTNWKDPSGLYLGIKGGKALNNHGHMDAGSFIYEAQGVRWAMDLGLQSYLSLEQEGVDLWNMGQNSQRWQVFRLNNFAHNTLTINDKLHKVNGFAAITGEFKNTSKLGARLDMNAIYSGEVKTAAREIAIINKSYLQIIDSLSTGVSPALVSWRMCTPADARIVNKNTLELTKDGKKIHLIVDAPSDVTLKIWTNDPPNSFDEANPSSRRVGFETSIAPNQSSALSVRLINK